MLRTLLLIVLAAAVDSAAVELAVNQRSGLSALTDKLPFTLSADIVPATSTGGVMGFCAGRAARVAGDATSIAAGAAFIFLSALQKAGYITINYEKFERDVRSLLDVNKDGKVDLADYNLLSARTVAMLSDNSAGTMSGLAAGFALGLKTG